MPPDLAGRLTPEELRFVVRHEAEHVRRRDIVLNLLLAALEIAHWFNPLVWLAVRRLPLRLVWSVNLPQHSH